MDTILLVEDDDGLRIGLSYDLEAEGYTVISTPNGKSAVEQISNSKQNISLVIMDVNLPEGNGFEFCRQIKGIKDIPVIFLTACDLITDEIRGFEVGADDYITKPFSNILLRKRVRAVLKRCEKHSADAKSKVYNDGYLSIDFDNLVAYKDNKSLLLTPTEYKLLNVLISNSTSVVTRQLILDKLWDNEGNFVDEHALTVNINRLRNKIENQDHKYIKTVYGLGYMWAGESIV